MHLQPISCGNAGRIPDIELAIVTMFCSSGSSANESRKASRLSHGGRAGKLRQGPAVLGTRSFL